MDEKRRKPLQFGLRDLLWAVLVVALLFGGLADRRQTESRLANIEAEVRRLSRENEKLLRREPEIILPRLGATRARPPQF